MSSVDGGARPRPRRILPVIIAAQFAGTSLWFAGNAVLPDLERSMGLGTAALGWVTSAVQLGFIVGTLAFALGGIADRFSPRGVFLLCSLVGAGFNLALCTGLNGAWSVLALRFLTGVALAGIYPVGMRIAASWYQGGLSAALGWLVGALVLGTAMPHGVRAAGADLGWRSVLCVVSVLAATGGLALYVLVPNGPHFRKSEAFHPRTLLALSRGRALQSAVLGYVGHMWELYAFWAVVPLLVRRAHVAEGAVSAWSFIVIAMGFFGCGLGGLLSARYGSARVARSMLYVSLLMCVASAVVLRGPVALGLGVLCVWGFSVVGDSPQFSSLVTKAVPADQVGTALTLTTSIGFAMTIPAIAFVTRACAHWPAELATLLLCPGPILGLWATRGLDRERR